jgi:hypothetical protein
MHVGRTLFAQLMDFLPWTSFARIVARYRGDERVRTLPCAQHLRVMAFAQLTYRESLRDIEAVLSAQSASLYGMGLRAPVRRSTLADANETRDWRIYAALAQRLIERARTLYVHEPLALDLEQTVYALDSTTIDLCRSVFPWAALCATQAAVKLHTLLDLRGAIPSFVHVSDGKFADVRLLDRLLPEAGAFYVMDRGYLDFERLYALDRAGAFFVTRAKRNLRAKRLAATRIDPSTGLRCDQTIRFEQQRAVARYPDALRRVHYCDPETQQQLVFLTNHTTLPALTVCLLYKSRWAVELFFKWVKQHLRIQRFYGTSANAVKTQLWIAIAVYVLVAIVKKQLRLSASLHTILQILSLSLFHKIPLHQALTTAVLSTSEPDGDKQLILLRS